MGPAAGAVTNAIGDAFSGDDDNSENESEGR